MDKPIANYREELEKLALNTKKIADAMKNDSSIKEKAKLEVGAMLTTNGFSYLIDAATYDPTPGKNSS